MDIDFNITEDQVNEVINTDSDSQVSPVGQPNANEPSLHEYVANGKTIREDLDTILKRASMGYNYAQLVNDHKTKESTLSEREKYVSEAEKQWKPYVDYAQQNPQWADYVRQSYEQNYYGARPDDSISSQPQDQATNSQIPQALIDEIKSLRDFKNEYYEHKRQTQIAEEDAALNNQIQEVQKQYADFDFSYTDPNTGKSLELRVLEHAQANNIASFKAAFRDLMFDQIVAKEVQKAKEGTIKDFQSRVKQGFISESDTSSSNSGARAPNLNRMTLDQAIQYGIEAEGFEF